MSHLHKDDFDRTLQIADFAAQRLENRRQYEFKIFISYVTLLVVAIYEGHHIEVPNGWYGLSVFVLLFVMHLFYISWAISLSVAMRNDSGRKNFYLGKAEYISDCLLKKFGDPLCRKLKNDYCTICPDENKVQRVPNRLGTLKHFDQIWSNWATPFQVVLPTIIFSLLVFNLSKELCTTPWNLVVLVIPFSFMLMIAIAYFRKN